MAYYSDQYKRSKFGFIETAVNRWLFDLIVKAYGQKDQPQNRYVVNQVQVERFLLDSRPLLEAFGLWTKHFKTFARNTLLLADLFQNQSNGTWNLDVNEISEYFALVQSTVKISDEFTKKIAPHCSFQKPDGEYFSILCYRALFFQTLLNDMKLKKYFPKLTSYIESGDPESVALFQINIERFARGTSDETIPMSKKDLTLTIGALLNVESIMTRFDHDHSNILEFNELEVAFPTYSRAIQILGNLEPDSKYIRTVFLFMIKKMRLPESSWEIFTFHYNPFIRNKSIASERLNIAALLYYIIQEPIEADPDKAI